LATDYAHDEWGKCREREGQRRQTTTENKKEREREGKEGGGEGRGWTKEVKRAILTLHSSLVYCYCHWMVADVTAAAPKGTQQQQQAGKNIKVRLCLMGSSSRALKNGTTQEAQADTARQEHEPPPRQRPSTPARLRR